MGFTLLRTSSCGDAAMRRCGDAMVFNSCCPSTPPPSPPPLIFHGFYLVCAPFSCPFSLFGKLGWCFPYWYSFCLLSYSAAAAASASAASGCFSFIIMKLLLNSSYLAPGYGVLYGMIFWTMFLLHLLVWIICCAAPGIVFSSLCSDLLFDLHRAHVQLQNGNRREGQSQRDVTSWFGDGVRRDSQIGSLCFALCRCQ